MPLAIDLFCGLGGWTEGLLAEGYRVVGFDIEARPYPAQLVLQDVLTIHGKQFRDAALIVASSPCEEFSYRHMPWSRARALGPPELGIKLFQQGFRIQQEAIEAAGRFIPLVAENVVGAQKFVGRSAWNFRSFHLWGDIPALMPVPIGREGIKQGGDWFGPQETQSMCRKYMSWSPERKEARAKIAKIPFELARHIASVYYPKGEK